MLTFYTLLLGILDLHKRKPDILKQSFQHQSPVSHDDVGAPPGNFDYKAILPVDDSQGHDESAEHMDMPGDEHGHDAPHGLQPGSLSDMHWFWYLTGVLAAGSMVMLVFVRGSVGSEMNSRGMSAVNQDRR